MMNLASPDRFQLKMVYGCGHSVQEDQPAETAASIINFAFRCDTSLRLIRHLQALSRTAEHSKRDLSSAFRRIEVCLTVVGR